MYSPNPETVAHVSVQKHKSKFVIVSVALPLRKAINPFLAFKTPMIVATARKQRGIDEIINMWPHS